MSSLQARLKLSGKHGFQTQGAGDEREARVGYDGNQPSARAGWGVGGIIAIIPPRLFFKCWFFSELNS